MRRQKFQAAAVEPPAERPGALQLEPARAPLRRVQWSSYYHRYFGRVRPGDRLPDNVQPLTLDDSTKTLYDVYCADDPALQPQRLHVARRCVSQMLIYGYRPAEERQEEFDTLVTAVAAPGTIGDNVPRDQKLAARARDFLLRWGLREFTPSIWDESQRNQHLTAAPETESIFARPTILEHDHGAFVVRKEVFLRTDVASVGHLINPENWERLGQFFARTFKEGATEDSLASAKADAWRGVLREDFICSWNNFTTNVFKQRLKIDYTVASDIARADYALMYEEDDQIVVNDGFFEVKVDGTLPEGWISGVMVKRLKFTSSLLNLFCPALLPMFLDSQASGFHRFFDDQSAKPTPGPVAPTLVKG